MRRFLLLMLSCAFLLVSLMWGGWFAGNALAKDTSPGSQAPVVKPSESLAKVLQAANKYSPAESKYGTAKKSSLKSAGHKSKKLTAHKSSKAKKAAYKKSKKSKATAYRKGKSHKGTAMKKKGGKKQASKKGKKSKTAWKS
jgi:hypothetical protein